MSSTAPPSGQGTDRTAEPVETYNPWTVVNVVFSHLAGEGLHPVLGGADPGEPAAALLRALGITPAAEGDARIAANRQARLADLRSAIFDDTSDQRATGR